MFRVGYKTVITSFLRDTMSTCRKTRSAWRWTIIRIIFVLWMNSSCVGSYNVTENSCAHPSDPANSAPVSPLPSSDDEEEHDQNCFINSEMDSAKKYFIPTTVFWCVWWLAYPRDSLSYETGDWFLSTGDWFLLMILDQNWSWAIRKLWFWCL